MPSGWESCWPAWPAPLCILLFRPLGLDLRQSAVLAGVLLTITWWSANIVKKIPASLFLLLVFALFSGAGLPKVFAFPLSDTFPMLVVTYLFSQAIANAGILESLIEPLLCRFVRTPLRCLLAIIITFFLMIYVIPQPLARLIIVGTVFRCFLDKAEPARADPERPDVRGLPLLCGGKHVLQGR